MRAGCQKLHVIADNYQLLILTAPVVPALRAGATNAPDEIVGPLYWVSVIPARSVGKFWAFYTVSDSKKANSF